MIYRNKRELILNTVKETDTVLDIGFCGQGVTYESDTWPHRMLQKHAKEVYGLDLTLPPEFKNNPHYLEASAENFHFDVTFDVVFAGDVIEHLSNPGLFLDAVRSHLKKDGRLILTTPNAFNLFTLAEKLTKDEPTVNSDHTFYFNKKVLSVLLEKNGMSPTRVDYLYTLDCDYKESLKKKFLNGIYSLLSRVTPKFSETLVIEAVVKE